MAIVRDHSRVANGDHSDHDIHTPDGEPEPGSGAFGDRAAQRRAQILNRQGQGDLRIQTAAKRAAAHRTSVNDILKGD